MYRMLFSITVIYMVSHILERSDGDLFMGVERHNTVDVSMRGGSDIAGW